MLNDFNKPSVVKYITPVNPRAQVSELLWQPEQFLSGNEFWRGGDLFLFLFFLFLECKKRWDASHSEKKVVYLYTVWVKWKNGWCKNPTPDEIKTRSTCPVNWTGVQPRFTVQIMGFNSLPRKEPAVAFPLEPCLHLVTLGGYQTA